MRVTIFMFVLLGLQAQGQTSEKDVQPASGAGTTQLYFGAGRNNAFRTLESNDAPFGKPITYQSEETAIKIWSYEAGLQRIVNNHFIMSGGLGVERFGETYTSTPQPETGDSTYSYINHYSYVSVPIQAYGYIGTNFKLMLGGGLQPGLVGKYNRILTVTDSIGTKTETETNKPEQLSSFLLNARFSSGLQWQWNKAMAVYLMYTYQIGLTSTYATQQPFKHYVRAGSVRFGLTFTIPE